MGKLWNSVRKFGLGYCDLPTMIWNVSVMLRVLTLNIDSRHTKRIPTINYIFFAFCAASYYYAYLVSMLWFVFVRSPETGDLVAAMVVMSLGVSSEIGTVKFVFMYFSVKKVMRMVDEYLECDAATVPGSRFSRNLMRTLRNVKKRAMFFWCLMMTNAATYNLMPMFQSGRHFSEDMYVIYGLEPMTESPNYEIALVMMAVSVWFIGFVSGNITGFIVIVAGYTEAHMLALSEELFNLWEDSIQEHYNSIEHDTDANVSPFQDFNVFFDEETKIKINKEVKKRLVRLIKDHARNIRLLHQVEDVFRLSIVVGFLFLIVGIIAELLGGLENTILQIPFTLSQVAMDCWTGQRVMDASLTFTQAVYDCKWENFDQHNMKIVLLMLQNAQRTLTLSAGGMTILSFSCLMSILRSIYSAYTTLTSMME